MTAQAEADNLHRRNNECRNRSNDVRRGMDEAEAQEFCVRLPAFTQP